MRSLDHRHRPPLSSGSCHPGPKSGIRCAIYTRRSVEDAAGTESGSLASQRRIAEAFIASRRAEGWLPVSGRYDDNGYSGATVERPGLKRLLSDIERGGIDRVVVYKIDRLTRSLADFGEMMEVFDSLGVSFVSVTQRLDTGTAAGRFARNVLLSFAQFERGMIADRVRDALQAARRKGKWVRGLPMLGYDVDRRNRRLIVNDEEAERVRAIFGLYLDLKTAAAVVEELDRLGWRTKRHRSRAGKVQGGKSFTRNTVYHMLHHIVYIGKVECDGTVYPGEQEAIVDEKLWRRVQDLLASNAHHRGATGTNGRWPLLTGLLYCRACGTPMQFVSARADEHRRYRYYACRDAQRRLRKDCPTQSVRAEDLEKQVADRVRQRLDLPGNNPSLQTAKGLHADRLAELARTRKAVRMALEEARVRTDASDHRDAELEGRATAHERRTGELRAALVALHRQEVDQRRAAKALLFCPAVWRSLGPREKWQVLRDVVHRVDYDGRTGTVEVELLPSSLSATCQPISPR